MYHRNKEGIEEGKLLNVGDICFLKEGVEHVAHPMNGAARILIIEKIGSI